MNNTTASKKVKVTKKQKINFARRFSFDDWMKICGDARLEQAIEEGEFEQAEVIAWELLSK